MKKYLLILIISLILLNGCMENDLRHKFCINQGYMGYSDSYPNNLDITTVEKIECYKYKNDWATSLENKVFDVEFRHQGIVWDKWNNPIGYSNISFVLK